MEFLSGIIDFILHIDKHLVEITTEYHKLTYLILFLIVFCETGLVVTPFLPGDSLLFAAGSIAALDSSPLNVFVLALIFFAAAFSGDNSNYFIGKFIGHKVYEKNYRLIKKEYLNRTHAFYEKHGGKTVVIARFIPIIRTFAPFVAGVGGMQYARFIIFGMVASLLWISVFVTSGYLFGQLPVVKNNFSLVTLGIILVSVLPIIIGFIRSRMQKA
ncbi:MAG TPA: DedA family protein [Bacteroidia bacterium]|nr:DedA family protein [Bacteroidia bacterium]